MYRAVPGRGLAALLFAVDGVAESWSQFVAESGFETDQTIPQQTAAIPGTDGAASLPAALSGQLAAVREAPLPLTPPAPPLRI